MFCNSISGKAMLGVRLLIIPMFPWLLVFLNDDELLLEI